MKYIMLIMILACSLKNSCMEFQQGNNHVEEMPDSPIPAERFFNTPCYSDCSESEKKKNVIYHASLSSSGASIEISDEEIASTSNLNEEIEKIQKIIYQSLTIDHTTQSLLQSALLNQRLKRLKESDEEKYIFLRDICLHGINNEETNNAQSIIKLKSIAQSLIRESINDCQHSYMVSVKKNLFLRNLALGGTFCEIAIMCMIFAPGLASLLTQC